MPDCLLTSKEHLMCAHSLLHSDSSSVVDDGGGGACLCLCVCVHLCVCVCVHHVTNGTDSVSPHSRWGKGGFFLIKKLFCTISYIYMKCDIIVSPPPYPCLDLLLPPQLFLLPRKSSFLLFLVPHCVQSELPAGAWVGVIYLSKLHH